MRSITYLTIHIVSLFLSAFSGCVFGFYLVAGPLLFSFVGLICLLVSCLVAKKSLENLKKSIDIYWGNRDTLDRGKRGNILCSREPF